jgi:hypothetical protein
LCKEQKDEKGKMKSFKEGELVFWMPKATKIKGGNLHYLGRVPLKYKKMFDNNNVELSTISDEGVEKVNINKLKAYHNKSPTNVIIATVTINTRPSGKIKNRHKKKNKPNFPPNLNTKPKNLPWIDPKPRATFNENDMEWIEEEDSRSGIPRMSKNERSRKFSYKGREKTTIPLHPRTYVNKERSCKNKNLVSNLD